MPTLALQLDSRGVVAVLSEPTKAGGLRFAESAIVDRLDDPTKQAETLTQGLKALLGGRVELLVALGPEDLRVKRLPAPPAPPEELPAIVALQAAREAGADAEDLVVDFLPPADAADGPTETFVAWADRITIEHWQEVATKLGGKLVAVTPRPLATLSLVSVTEASLPLLVSRAGDAIDFAATTAGEPTLLRSAHLGEGGDAAAGRELSRTLLSFPDAEPRILHSSATADGDSIDWSKIANQFGAEPAALQGLEATAALGLAYGYATGTTPSLNLADPRRPPVAETGRRRQVLLVATAATVLLAGGWMAYERVADLDRQIESKRAEIAEAEKAVEAFEPYRERVAAIDAWRVSDVTWLDEIERLGRQLRPVTLDGKDFPEDADVRVSQLRATALAGRGESGGKIELTATARSSSTRELEARLRDDTHPVEPISIAENPAGDAYRFDYTALLRSPAATDEDDLPTGGPQ